MEHPVARGEKAHVTEAPTPTAAPPESPAATFKPDVKHLSLAENAPMFPEVPPEVVGTIARLQYRTWKIFEDPETAKTALWVNIWILVLILISAVVAVVETMPGVHREQPLVWLLIESFFVGNFSLELILRFWACDNKHEFVQTGMNWIDFVSIAPFYMEIIIGSVTTDFNLKFLRILRLGRALRLVKLVRYSSGMQMIKHCISQSMDALQLFGFIFTVLLIVCASGIYYTERGKYHDDDELYWRTNPVSKVEEVSPFQSVPGSCWWCIVTLTTVGYGDYYPITYLGQFIGFITQMLGVLCLALPLSIIGSNFHEIRQALKESEAEGDEEEEDEQIRTPLDAVDNVSDMAKEGTKITKEVINIGQAVLTIIDLLATCKSVGVDDVHPVFATDNPLMVTEENDTKDAVPHELETLESDLLGLSREQSVAPTEPAAEHSASVKVDGKHIELIEDVLARAKYNLNKIHLQLR